MGMRGRVPKRVAPRAGEADTIRPAIPRAEAQAAARARRAWAEDLAARVVRAAGAAEARGCATGSPRHRGHRGSHAEARPTAWGGRSVARARPPAPDSAARASPPLT